MAKKRRIKKVCPIHGEKLDRTTTTYGHRWSCPVPNCTVACWGGDTSSPADDATRQARRRCHAAFDLLWHDEAGPFSAGHRPNNRHVRRHRAYRWLAEQMGLDINGTHFGLFNRDQCERALSILEASDLYAGMEGGGQ